MTTLIRFGRASTYSVPHFLFFFKYTRIFLQVATFACYFLEETNRQTRGEAGCSYVRCRCCLIQFAATPTRVGKQRHPAHLPTLHGRIRSDRKPRETARRGVKFADAEIKINRTAPSGHLSNTPSAKQAPGLL